MTMKAAYLLVDMAIVTQWRSLSEDDLIAALDAEEQKRPDDVAYVDDSWDAIHFLLCDRTTAQPIEGNALSEAVVGVHWFDEEDEDAAFIAYCQPDDVKRIHEAVRKIRADELPIALEVPALRAAAVYQAGWFAAEPEWSLETLMHDFADVQALYARAAAQERAVVVSFL